MTDHIDFQKYLQFVDAVTSDESRDFVALSDRLLKLDSKGANIERLLTGSIGLSSESGEILEIVKKLVFQGKPWNEETKKHLKKEIGDCMWYVGQLLFALDLTLDEAVQENITKLENRYPGGQFDAYYSENREAENL